MSGLEGRMSRLKVKTSVGSGVWRRISGLLARFLGWARCPGWGRMSRACRYLAAGRLLWVMLQGPDVRGPGQMSRS